MNKYLVFLKHICKELIWGGVVPLLLMLVFSTQTKGQSCGNVADFTFTPNGICNAITLLSPANTNGTHSWVVGAIAPATGTFSSTAVNPTFFLPGLSVGGTVQITHTITIAGATTTCTQFMTLMCEVEKCNEANTPAILQVPVSVNEAGCGFIFNLSAYVAAGFSVQSIAFGDGTTMASPPTLVNYTYNNSIGATNVIVTYLNASGVQFTCTFPIIVNCRCSDPTFTYTNASFNACTSVCVQFNDNCNAFTNTTHTWNFGDGSPTITGLQGQPIVGDPLNTGTYDDPIHCYNFPLPTSISVSHGVNGLVSTTVNLQPNTYLPPNTFIVGQPNQQTDIDVTTLPANVSNGATIVVFGDLLIDHNYTFTNSCQLFMQPGSSMTAAFDLANFGTTVAHNFSSIQAACPTMWRGMILNNGTNLTMNNSTVTDAQYAIRFDNQNVITLNGNTFGENYISIYTPPTAQSNFLRNSALTMNNCTFTCATPLVAAFPGQLPLPGNFSYVGMEINNLAVLALPPGNTVLNIGNNFNTLGNGIVVRNVGLLQIDGTAFYNMGTLGGQMISSNNPNACITGNQGCNLINGVGLFYDNDPGTVGTLNFNGLRLYPATYWETFVNVRTGIYTSNVTMNVQNTDMIYNQALGPVGVINTFNNGILVQGFQAGQTANITSSLMSQHQRGIEIQIAESAASIFIDGNNLTGLGNPNFFGTNNSVGIAVTTSIGTVAANPVVVTNNTVADRRICYNILNLNDITLSDNIARCNDDDDNTTAPTSGLFQFGFNVSNCGGVNSLISCNQARPFSNAGISTVFNNTGAVPAFQHIGFNFNNSPLTIRCNSADRLRTGYRFAGAAVGTRFIANTMNNHRRGLWLASTADIGVQGEQTPTATFDGNANIWTTPEPLNAQNAPAFLEFPNGTALDPVNLARQGNNRFWINPANAVATAPSANPLCYWPTRVSNATPTASGVWPTAPNQVWYQATSGTPQTCTNFAACANFTPLPLMENETETKIAEGDTVAVMFRPESMWTSQQHLYEKLAESNDISALDPAYYNFFTEAENSIIGDLYTVKSDIKQLSQPTVNGQSEATTTLVAQLAAIDQQMLPDMSLESLQALITLRQPLADSLNALILAEAALFQQQITDRNAAIDAITAENESIVTDRMIQENERIINRICLQTTAKGNHALTHEQAYEVFGVANQCPFKGGTAVYRARALYELYNVEQVYDDEALCSAVGIQYLASPEENEISPEPLSLSPNPADQHIDVRCTVPNATLHITDLTGREVLPSVIVPNISLAYRWDVSSLPVGIYFIRTVSDGHTLGSQRIVIAR